MARTSLSEIEQRNNRTLEYMHNHSSVTVEELALACAERGAERAAGPADGGGDRVGAAAGANCRGGR